MNYESTEYLVEYPHADEDGVTRWRQYGIGYPSKETAIEVAKIRQGRVTKRMTVATYEVIWSHDVEGSNDAT